MPTYESLPAQSQYFNGFLFQKMAQDLQLAGLAKRTVYGAVGNGEAVLKYLAPYVYRVALSDNRIESVDQQGVTYKVKPSGKNYTVTRRSEGEQFVRSFVQHVLPRGFQRVRYYGWMSPNCKLQLADLGWLVWIWRGWKYWLGSAMFEREPRKRPIPTCSRCGGELELLAITNQDGVTLWKKQTEHALERTEHALGRGPP